MLQLSNASIAARAEQSSDLDDACGLGFVAMVDMEPAPFRRRSSADGALSVLFREHFGVCPALDPIVPTGVDVGVPFGVLLAPAFAARAVARRVLVSALGDLGDGARFAVVLLAVIVTFVVAELVQKFDAFASWAPFATLRSAPSRVRGIARLAVSDLTFPAIAGKAISAFLANVKLSGLFGRLASGAKFFCEHVILLDRWSLSMKTLSLSTQGVSTCPM